MENKKEIIDENSPYRDLTSENIVIDDEKTTQLKAKLDSLKIRVNGDYQKPCNAWEVKCVDSEYFKPIGTIGNFSLVIGKAKAKKSFFIGIAVSTALNKNILHGRFRSNLPSNKKEVLYFDTEQSQFHVHKALIRICKQVNVDEPQNLHVYGLRKLSPKERLSLIEFAIYNNPNVGFVVIDGVKDLVNSINDEVEASMMANKLLQWTEDNNTHIVTVLHQNKGDKNARGHIGTELINKAETVLTVTVDSKNDNVSIVEPQQCRNLPFDAFAFQINEYGLPELIDNFSIKSNSKEKFDIINSDNSIKEELLKIAFADSKLLVYKDLIDAIKNAYKSKYHKDFADLRTKRFIKICREDNLICQDKRMYPYYLCSS